MIDRTARRGGRSWLMGLMLPIMVALLVLKLLTVGGCTRGTRAVADARLLHKIEFNLSALNAEGLSGPPEARHPLVYEFCIPEGARFEAKVRAIDPSLRIVPGSPGRAGCGPGQLLCVGNTRQPGFRVIILNLARLKYVERIVESTGE